MVFRKAAGWGSLRNGVFSPYEISQQAPLTPAVPATVPAAFTVGQWTLTDSPSLGGDTLTIDITIMPSDGGSPITALQYTVNAGSSWNTIPSGTGVGSRIITVTALTSTSVQIRAVNAVGNALASDTKTATPTVAAGGGNLAVIAKTYDNVTYSMPAGLTCLLYTSDAADDTR